MPAAPPLYPTCADWSTTGLWLHLLPALPTGKAACGRIDDAWRPPEAVDVTPRDVEHREAAIPAPGEHDRVTALICGHCATIYKRAPHRIAVCEVPAA